MPLTSRSQQPGDRVACPKRLPPPKCEHVARLTLITAAVVVVITCRLGIGVPTSACRARLVVPVALATKLLALPDRHFEAARARSRLPCRPPPKARHRCHDDHQDRTPAPKRSTTGSV